MDYIKCEIILCEIVSYMRHIFLFMLLFTNISNIKIDKSITFHVRNHIFLCFYNTITIFFVTKTVKISRFVYNKTVSYRTCSREYKYTI